MESIQRRFVCKATIPTQVGSGVNDIRLGQPAQKLDHQRGKRMRIELCTAAKQSKLHGVGIYFSMAT